MKKEYQVKFSTYTDFDVVDSGMLVLTSDNKFQFRGVSETNKQLIKERAITKTGSTDDLVRFSDKNKMAFLTTLMYSYSGSRLSASNVRTVEVD